VKKGKGCPIGSAPVVVDSFSDIQFLGYSIIIVILIAVLLVTPGILTTRGI